MVLALPPSVKAQVGTVEGIVRDEQTGDRIPAAIVTVVGTDFADTSNVSGFFQITNVPVGPQTVVVRAVGYLPQTASNVLVSVGAPTSLLPTLRDKVSFLGAKYGIRASGVDDGVVRYRGLW